MAENSIRLMGLVVNHEFVDELSSFAEEPDTEWGVFLQSYTPNSKELVLVVEGNDDVAFYSHMLRRDNCLGAFKVYPIRCYGKSRVLQNLEDFVSRFNVENPKVLFFVDKDHDDFVGIDMPFYKYLYVTDVYSIENYFCDLCVIERVITEIGDMSVKDNRVQVWLDRYSFCYDGFYDVMMYVMSWVITARKMNVGVCLSNINNEKIFGIDDLCAPVIRKNNEELRVYLEQVMSAESLPLDLIEETIADLRTHSEPKTWIRGKQELWYVLKFIKKMSQKGGLSMKFAINENNALSILMSKIDVPLSLRQFMDVVAHDI